MVEKRRNDSYHIKPFMPVILVIIEREREREYCQKLSDLYLGHNWHAKYGDHTSRERESILPEVK